MTLFLLPHFLHFYAVSGHSWGTQGSKFSLEFLAHNLDTNGIYYLNNKFFPLLITVLALIGLFCPQKGKKWRWLIFLWFLPFWGIFLFFYAGSYTYGADVRFALTSFMPLAVLAGIGGGWIGNKQVKAVPANGMGVNGDCREKGAGLRLHGSSPDVFFPSIHAARAPGGPRGVGSEI